MHIADTPGWVTLAYVTVVAGIALLRGGLVERVVAVLQQAIVLNSLIVFDPTNGAPYLLLSRGVGSLA